MYKIGDTIVYSDGKIYSIVDKLERDYGRGPQMYFELKQNDLYKKDKSTSVFAPFAKVQEESRDLSSKKEILHLIDSFPALEPFWINDCKQRKIVFAEYSTSRDIKQVAILVKSIYLKNEELKEINKAITITDKMLFERLKTDLFIEISLVLKIELDSVVDFINNRLKK